MSGELPVIILEGDDESLSGIRGEPQLDPVLSVTLGVGHRVLDLGGGEIEVAEFLWPDHQGVGVVGPGGQTTQLDLGLTSDGVEVVGSESALGQGQVEGGRVAHVVQAVFDDDVFALHKVFVLDLKVKKNNKRYLQIGKDGKNL